MLHGIFNGTENVFVDDVTGIADDEEVAEFLVEDDFRCHTAVGAAQHHGEGMLTLTELFPQFGIIIFWCQVTRNKAGVTLFE